MDSTAGRIVEALDHIAPPSLAESWDNVGLLVGDPAQPITRIVLTIDYTAAVAADTPDGSLVVAYHPPIFKPLKRLIAGDPIYDAIRRGIAIYSPHTALDVADGGTNDVLADLLALQDRRPLAPRVPGGKLLKLVTFLPADALQSVSDAIFDAGAGCIGRYHSCSFRSAGTGTFFGTAGTNPTVGEPGHLEIADEMRLETVVPADKLDAVVVALRQTHPYEEPAFDLMPLEAAPTNTGIGRIGTLPTPTERAAIFATIKAALSLQHLLIAGPTAGAIRTIAICAGSGAEFLDYAIAAKVDLYLTGELKHHDALRAAAVGLTVVCTLHSHSERITLHRLRDQLAKEFPSLAIDLAAADRDPFIIA